MLFQSIRAFLRARASQRTQCTSPFSLCFAFPPLCTRITFMQLHSRAENSDEFARHESFLKDDALQSQEEACLQFSFFLFPLRPTRQSSTFPFSLLSSFLSFSFSSFFVSSPACFIWCRRLVPVAANLFIISTLFANKNVFRQEVHRRRAAGLECNWTVPIRVYYYLLIDPSIQSASCFHLCLYCSFGIPGAGLCGP